MANGNSDDRQSGILCFTVWFTDCGGEHGETLILFKLKDQRMKQHDHDSCSSNAGRPDVWGFSCERTQVSPCATTPFILSADIGRQRVLTYGRHHRPHRLAKYYDNLYHTPYYNISTYGLLQLLLKLF